MKWMGKIGNNVEASIRLDGILLHEPKKQCRCGAIIDISETAETEAGLKLSVALKNVNGKIAWIKKWNALAQKVLAGKVSLDKFFEEQIRLLNQYREREWGARNISQHVTITCPKCSTFMGKAEVTLRPVNEPELKEITKKQLAGLKPSRGMMSYASKRMNFGNVEEFEVWLSDKDAKQAKEVLRNAIAELENFNLSYEISLVTSELQSQIVKIDKETERRRMELVNATEKIVKERTHIIR